MIISSKHDVWLKTVLWLGNGTVERGENRAVDDGRSAHCDGLAVHRRWQVRRKQDARSALRSSSNPRIVNILERISSDGITDSWRDPTSCRYGAQVWKLSLARRSGRCAKSGLDIHRGDAVYRSLVRGDNTPMNAGEMILGWVVAKCCSPFTTAQEATG